MKCDNCGNNDIIFNANGEYVCSNCGIVISTELVFRNTHIPEYIISEDDCRFREFLNNTFQSRLGSIIGDNSRLDIINSNINKTYKNKFGLSIDDINIFNRLINEYIEKTKILLTKKQKQSIFNNYKYIIRKIKEQKILIKRKDIFLTSLIIYYRKNNIFNLRNILQIFNEKPRRIMRVLSLVPDIENNAHYDHKLDAMFFVNDFFLYLRKKNIKIDYDSIRKKCIEIIEFLYNTQYKHYIKYVICKFLHDSVKSITYKEIEKQFNIKYTNLRSALKEFRKTDIAKNKILNFL